MPNAIIGAPNGAKLHVPYTGPSPDPQLISAALSHYMSTPDYLGSLDLTQGQSPTSSFASPAPPRAAPALPASRPLPPFVPAPMQNASPPQKQQVTPAQSMPPRQGVSSAFAASPQTLSFPPSARPPYYSKEAQAQALARTPKNVLPTADTSQFALDPTPYLKARAAAITHYTHLLQRSIATPTDTAQYLATVQKNMDALQKAQYFDTPEGKMLRHADITAGVYRPSAAPPPPAQAGGSFFQTASNFVQTQGQDAFSLLQGLYSLPQTAEKAAGNILQGGWAGIRGAYDEATGDYADSQAQAQTAQNSYDQTSSTVGAMLGAQGATGNLSETVTPSSDDLGRADPSALHHGILGDLAIAAGTEAGGRHAQSVQQYGQIAGNVGAFTLQHPLLQAANVAPGAAELSGLARLGRLGEGARLVQGAIDAKAADAGAALAGRVYGQFPALARGVGLAQSVAGVVGSAVHDTLRVPVRAPVPGLGRGAFRSGAAPLSVGEALGATMPSLKKGGGTRAVPRPLPPGVGPSLTSGLASPPGQFERMPSLSEGLSASLPAAADSLGTINPGADPLSTYNLASAIIGNPADNARMEMKPPAQVQDPLLASTQSPGDAGKREDTLGFGDGTLQSFYRRGRGAFPNLVVVSPDTTRKIMSFQGKTDERSLQSYGFALSPHHIDDLETAGILPFKTINHFRQGVAENQGHGISVLTAHKGRGIAALRKTVLHEPQHVLQFVYPLSEDAEKNLIASYNLDPKMRNAWWRFQRDMHSRGYSKAITELPSRLASGQYRDVAASLDKMPTMDAETAKEMFTRYVDAVRKQYNGDAAAEIYNAAPSMRRALLRREGLSGKSNIARFAEDNTPLFFAKEPVSFDQLFPDQDEPPPQTPAQR